MIRNINEYFNEHCYKTSCEECEMENDQKEEYTCYHQGFYVKGYQQGRIDAIDEYSNELFMAIKICTVNCKLDLNIDDLHNLEIIIKGLAEQLKEQKND